MRPLFARALVGAFGLVNRLVPWWRLPTWLGIPNLLAHRLRLRGRNLHDTWTPGALRRRGPDEVPHPSVLAYRTADGSWNDLEHPDMGRAGTRFGRNSPPDESWPEVTPGFSRPSPREISLRLMTRDVFKPATSLNVLAAAWIQFQVHDWFDHGQGTPGPDDLEVDLPEGDDWHECPMRVPRTPADPTRCPLDHGRPPSFLNRESHWWDGSSIYGSDLATQERIRAHVGGRLLVQSDGTLPIDGETGRVRTGFTENWWTGLALLHTLFSLEHNAVCERLQATYPEWPDGRIFQTARLVVSALMAKIHTLEWTPAITDHPTLHVAMRANWSGLAQGRLRDFLGPLAKSEVLGGIRATTADHHGAPFQLTEEFASVYRLHPLIPDELRLLSLGTGEELGTIPFEEATLHRALGFLDAHGVTAADLLYSLGVAHPGQVCLHNYPRFLQRFTRPDGTVLDVASVDVLRDRERGVPRYCAFRRILGMPVPGSFAELTHDPVWVEELRDLYGEVERVDLLVGMLAETPPPGFGFSDTAFRVFVLMASRRLRSDRFFTTDFTPQVYTPEGIRWVEESDMTSVLLRHYPELGPALAGVANPFTPWRRVAAPESPPGARGASALEGVLSAR